MPCQHIDLGNGVTAMVRTAAPKRRRCSICHSLCFARLCDYKLPNGKTCDAALCARHAHHVAPDFDYCPKHRPQQLGLGLEFA